MTRRAGRDPAMVAPVKREYDVILFGATGFTGGLTAAYLAAHVPESCGWALAGRDRAKLEAVRDRLTRINPACAGLTLLHADVGDPASLDEIAAAGRVVVTTVGPYVLYGDALVAACARNGTDYVDLCGEPEFHDLTYLRHHARAKETGARLVHACGLDSIPWDLGVYYTVKRLPRDVPLRVEARGRTNASISGGSFASALTVASRLRQTIAAARERARAEPRPAGRRVRGRRGKPMRDNEGRWLLPMSTVDPQVVVRSAAALDEYGPDFTYTQYLSLRRLSTVAGLVAGIGAVGALAQIPPARRALGRLIKPGQGPSESRRARSWFTVRFTGEGGGQRVVTEVAGGDPGYDETAKMLGESALCLAFDSLPETSGQVTTAAAMGDALLARLVDAGLAFRVVPTA